MLFLISPAKKLVCEGLDDRFGHTNPEHIQEAEYLVQKLKKKTPIGLQRMMGISKDLALLNHDRFQHWQAEPQAEESMQAVLMFQGDVYQGLQAKEWSKKDMQYAQSHLRILSGLYGILRPLDRIMPYRLEMGSDFKVTAAKKNLYSFWGDTLLNEIKEELESAENPMVVNLASNEYAKAVRLNKAGIRVITPEFKEAHKGTYKMMSFFAKKARGMMARFAVEHRLDDVEHLKAFDSEGYYFNKELTQGDRWVFTRDKR
ncbi:MAG: peroxide stress protein YaaA [Flavobacteriales bacterium]|nr:peroxide stress protein YaaA [Flavobacteriales bacterium]